MAGNKCLCTGGMMIHDVCNSHPLTYRISYKQTHLLCIVIHIKQKLFLFIVSNQTIHVFHNQSITEAKYTFTFSIFIQAPYKQTTVQCEKVLNT